MSSSAVALQPVRGVQEPRFLSLPPGSPDVAGDFGDRACGLAELAGLVLDPWQQLTLRAMLRRSVDGGRWAAYESLILVPRQNGKSVTLEAFDLAKLFLSPPGHMIMHTAHLFPTAMESFRHLTGLIRNCPELWAEVLKVNGSHGQEGIELTNGSRLRFAARGVNGSGRGFSPDDVIFDEAYRLPAEAEEALLYAISAKKDPQLVYASSTGQADSDTLWALVERGRKGDDPSLMMAEWSADPDLDLTVEEQFNLAVRQANPAYGYRLEEWRTLAEYRKAKSQKRLEGFGRERLGWWADTGVQSVIDLKKWSGLADPASEIVGPVVFAVDVSRDGEMGAITAAGFNEAGKRHVEVIDHRPGTAWIPARCAQLNLRHDVAGFVLDSQGPAAFLKADLESAGIFLTVTRTPDVVSACGMVMDWIASDDIAHLGQPELDAAVRAAQKRPIGDGAWAWGRKASGADISPLVAGTLALYVARLNEPVSEINIGFL